MTGFVCPTCVELAARVIELEGELARMRISRTPMSAVERDRLLAERQHKHYEERKGVLPEMTFRDAECHARARAQANDLDRGRCELSH
jgi:hypothetical protein